MQAISGPDFFREVIKTPKAVFSSNISTKEDEMETKLVEVILDEKFDCFQSDYDSKHKEEVLAKLSEIIKNWSIDIALKENFPEEIANKLQARLFTFGSYRLNVTTNDGDIDTICVVPKSINREKHFFGDLVEILKNNPKVENLIPVINSRVPIIKMNFDKIDIDISFAQLDMSFLSDDLDLSDNKILINMDEQSCKSLNGRRVADTILRSVPNQENFRVSLKWIKLWAKNKGIYSNVMGYLGGISWAIMLAKICQMYPNLKPNRLIQKFFKIYSKWEWDKISVKIEEIVDEPANPKNGDQWTEAEILQKKNKMFIITPSFPCMNSSHMVTDSTLNIMKNYLEEGHNQLEKCFNTSLSNILERENCWISFFKKEDFYSKYRNFIQIDILGNDTNQNFKFWAGFVASKIRRLVQYFENYDFSLNLFFDIHLSPESISRKAKGFKYCKSYFVGLKLKKEHYGKYFFDFFPPIVALMREINEEKSFARDPKLHNLRIFRTKKEDVLSIISGEVGTPLTEPALEKPQNEEKTEHSQLNIIDESAPQKKIKIEKPVILMEEVEDDILDNLLS